MLDRRGLVKGAAAAMAGLGPGLACAGRRGPSGLTFRPCAETARDTLAWWVTLPEARRAKPQFALTPEREPAALADWHALGR